MSAVTGGKKRFFANEGFFASKSDLVLLFFHRRVYFRVFVTAGAKV